MLDQHYGEKTPYIKVDGTTPYANSMPLNVMFLNKKYSKVLKKADVHCDSFMNVCYEREQPFENGTVLNWQLEGMDMDVYLIGCGKLFVKGKHVWAYCVGIIE